MHTAVAHRAEFIQELLRLVLQQAHLLLQPIGVFWVDAADAMYVSVRLLFEVKQLRAEVHIEACGHQVSSVSLCFQHRMRRHLGRHGMRRGGAPTVRSLQMGVRVVGVDVCGRQKLLRCGFESGEPRARRNSVRGGV